MSAAALEMGWHMSGHGSTGLWRYGLPKQDQRKRHISNRFLIDRTTKAVANSAIRVRSEIAGVAQL